jgi:hypothetical protein
MPIMTREEEEILDKLIRLAGGDLLLVERAFKEISSKSEKPDLIDIVRYIEAQKKQQPRAA